MSHLILVTGAAGGTQGSTGRRIAALVLERGIPIRALVHKLDARSDDLRNWGAEVIEGDLLSPTSVQAAMEDVKRAYFTYPVTDGLLESSTIFDTSAREAGLEMVVNNSQFQGTPDDPAFRDLRHSGICSTGSLIVSSTGLRLGPFIFRHRPITKTSARWSAAASPSRT
jgi:NAD(P)-dependent dehydrogenase (short-subunit alcohol dehydrogenase family)